MKKKIAHSVSCNKTICILLGILSSIVIGTLSAAQPLFLFIVIGVFIYILLVYLATNEKNVKNVLPYFFFVILFQDTIMRKLELHLHLLSSLFSYVDESFILVCLPALIIRLFKEKKFQGKIIFVAVTGLLFFGLSSSLINNVPIAITLKGALLMTKGLLFALIFANINFEKRDILLYVKWIRRTAFMVLFFGMIDLVFTHQFRKIMSTNNFFDYRGGIVSVISLFIHPGIYGWFMLFIGIYSAVSFKMTGKNKYLLGSSVFMLFAILSFRFKTMLAMIVIMFIFYLMKGKKALVFILPASLLMIIGLLVFGEYILNLSELTIKRYLAIDMYSSARKALYIVSFWIGKDNFPFGVGFGRYGGFVARDNYSPVYYNYGMNHIYGLSPEYTAYAMDTYWPNVIGELGFIGAAIMLAILIYIIIFLIKSYKKVYDVEVKIFVLFAGLELVQGLCESSGEPVFNSAPQNVFIFAVVGIAISILYNPVFQNSKYYPNRIYTDRNK